MRTLGDQVRAFREGKGWNSTEMAKAAGTKRQNIEQLEAHGNRIPKYLGGLAAAMGRTIDEMLAEAGLAPKTSAIAAPAKRNSGIAPEQDSSAYLPGFEPLQIALLANSGSMGSGNEQHDEVVIGRLTVSPQWVLKAVRPSKLENLRFIHGYGDSMEPTFSDGDILLVDLGKRDPRIDGIYVLETNHRLFIKRVTGRFDGVPEITSDNPSVKTIQALDGSQQVEVIGRVVWKWIGKKL